jgi:hypothetical protein
VLEQPEKNMGENFVRAVADEDIVRRNPVITGNRRFQQFGIRIGIQPQPVADLAANRFQHARAGAVGIFVGIQLDQIAELGLLTRHIRGEVFDDLAPEGGHG